MYPAIAEALLNARRERKRGHPTESLTARLPEEIIQAIDSEARNKTEGAVALLDCAVDAKTEMGKEWLEVVIFAHREGLTEGQALGRLARLGLKSKR